jgi:hypothetical protein
VPRAGYISGPNRILTVKGGEIFGDHSPLGHPRSLILSAGFGGDAPASSASTAQPSAAAVAQKKACKEDLAKNFFKWQDITTTFEEFPYFVEYAPYHHHRDLPAFFNWSATEQA